MQEIARKGDLDLVLGWGRAGIVMLGDDIQIDELDVRVEMVIGDCVMESVMERDCCVRVISWGGGGGVGEVIVVM